MIPDNEVPTTPRFVHNGSDRAGGSDLLLVRLDPDVVRRALSKLTLVDQTAEEGIEAALRMFAGDAEGEETAHLFKGVAD